jgi:uncharacterized protein (DUF885 family)
MMRILLLLVFWVTAIPLLLASDIVDAMNRFKADKGALNRLIENHKSEEYYVRILKLFEDELALLQKVPYDGLSKNDKTDYHLFKNHLQKSQYFFLQDYEKFRRIKHVAAFATDLYQFNVQRRRAIRPQPRDISHIFSTAEQSAKDLTKNLTLSKGFDTWQEASLAAEIIRSLRENTEKSFQFYNDYDPEFSWWAVTPFKNLMVALQTYEDALKNHYDTTKVIDDGSGIIGQPLGRQLLEKELAYEWIPYSPEELIAEAQKQYDWCEMEMIKASENLGFGTDWKKALEYVKDQYMPPGDWPQEVGRMAEEAIDFLDQNDLLTIPATARETWRMNMLSAESQKLNAFFLGGESIYISYPTPEMTHTEKMMSLRGNNPHFGRAVVHHELIPGHHLQWYMNDRHYKHRNGYGTAFWVEGWPLYWEFTLYEKGFPRDEEDKIGMLFWRMHRAARIIFSLNYHLGKMTPQQCIDFLVDKVGHERFNAEAEVRRSFTGNYGPLYQLAYMTGGLQVLALKKECVDSGRMTIKEFNDTFIRQNNMPIELLRAHLLNIELPENYTSAWRFLEP